MEMGKPRQEAGESVGEALVLLLLAGQEFEGHEAVQARLPGFVDDAHTAPAELARTVLTTTPESRRSLPESVAPAVKPNQPKARINVPKTTIGS